MSVGDKRFYIEHVFTDVEKMELDKNNYGKTEWHHHIPWRIRIIRYADSFTVQCGTPKFLGSKKWKIHVTAVMYIYKSTGAYETHVANVNLNENGNSTHVMKRVNYSDIDKYVDKKGNWKIGVKFSILETSGINTEIWRCFHDSEFSDVVLVVKLEKFLVLKSFLAVHSTYFKALLFGNFNESGRLEVELQNIDSYAFQKFLEVIYGEPAIDEDTLIGILELADMYDSKTAIRRCEEFLLNKSERNSKEKFELASQYKMEKLQEVCIDGMKSVSDLRSIVPEDCDIYSKATWKQLFVKALSLK